MSLADKYYVYVYIDPRDFSEFYYGKGVGDRMRAHLHDSSDSEKAERIKEIKKCGMTPIVRVIAKDLAEDEAFLVEKTLLWKLGRSLTNVSSGKFKDKFRPHKTMHKELFSFDYQRGVYFFNIGDVSARGWRDWEDMRKFGFITAGGDPVYSNQIKNFRPGDVFFAFQSRSGYVGVGIILEAAVPYRDYKHRGRSLSDYNIELDLGHDQHNFKKCEWLCKVRWVRTVSPELAKWLPNAGLYAKQAIRASLQGQEQTLRFLEREFRVNIGDMLSRSLRNQF